MKNEIKYFSMFTGVGGFELGLRGASEECCQDDRLQFSTNEGNGGGRRTYTPVGFSEIDKYSSELLAKKFPNITNYGDATKINPGELPDFDMLCGGFPCQAFSIAGKRRGFEDTRGTLFFEITRILEFKRPKIVFLENVKGLLNHEKGKTFSVTLQALDELGYDVQWMVLNSKFFGVPQNRERVFIIANLRGERRPEILPFRENGKKYVEESSVQETRNISKCITARYWKQGQSDQYLGESELRYVGAIMSEKNKQWLKDGKEFSRNFPQGQRVYSDEGVSSTLAGQAGGLGGKTGLYKVGPRAVLTPDRPTKRQNGRRIKEPGETSFTLTGQDKHEVTEGMKIRRLTPKECERLQGFPDGWTEGFSDTQRYKMMGNAVTVNVIREIGKKLFEEAKEDDRT